jgi:predicted nucleic acid-binding protein
MVVVDSSVWIDFFNGTATRQTNLLFEWLGYEPIAVGDLMLAEVLQGFREERHYQLAHDLLLTLNVVNMLNTSIALQCARNYRALRQRGVTVRKVTDCIIATWCIEHGLPLLHSDRDFVPFHEHLGLQEVVGGL